MKWYNIQLILKSIPVVVMLIFFYLIDPLWDVKITKTEEEEQ